MFYLTTHSTHFIYGYMASDIWLRTILIVRKETRCRHKGYSYRLTARVLLYAPVVEHWLYRSTRQNTKFLHQVCCVSDQRNFNRMNKILSQYKTKYKISLPSLLRFGSKKFQLHEQNPIAVQDKVQKKVLAKFVVAHVNHLYERLPVS